ncbi:hypothetical protein Slin15195_G088820 [Septoria linicola]|uniref:Uncharacterized protein n=1 Tax=Septoria linicola TaxID=215465 RepID=A0A9Q9ENK2_9PEZI|nr:hypothetical protein Slin15195_G088820 [Septoria linicola]
MLLRSRPKARSLRAFTRSYLSQHEARNVLNTEAIAKLQRHEQAIAARSRKVPPRGSDKWFYLTAIGLTLATPPIVYFWWQHRAEHMGKKKEEMIRQIEIKRKEFLENER